MRTWLTRRRLVNVVWLLIVSGSWFLIGWLMRGAARTNPEVALIEQVRRRLLTESLDDSLTTRELTYAAVRGMLSHTEDSHAALLEPPVAQRFEEDFAGKSGIVGLHLGQDECGQLYVEAVTPDEPADLVGLQAGDVILSVDGVSFDASTTATEASLLIRGPVGEPAHIVVQRGDAVLAFDPLRRARDTVVAQMLEEDIAYLGLSGFTTNAPHEVERALEDLLTRQPRGLIWDLRANGGGSMEATREVLSQFIEEGLLFSVELRGGRSVPFEARGGGLATDLPMVILIDEYTYSAGETAAATIKDRGRGTLIGGPTYGKSTVNATYPLGQECMVQMTIGKILSPTGQWYQGTGVEPDIPMVDDPHTERDEVQQFAVAYLTGNCSGCRPSQRMGRGMGKFPFTLTWHIMDWEPIRKPICLNARTGPRNPLVTIQATPLLRGGQG